MSKILLADGVEFTIGMTLYKASGLELLEEKTSDETHYIKNGHLYRRQQHLDEYLHLPNRCFSTRDAAIDSVIAGYNRQIEILVRQRDQAEATLRLDHEKMEAYITARGFALRDDRSIREGDPHFEGAEEAYSLHTIDPFERHEVYAGRREWAVEQAYKYVSAQ